MRKIGISLITLIITIVIIIILSTAVILGLSNSGVFDSANYATMLSDMSSIREVVEIYKVTNDNVATNGNISVEELNKNKYLKQEVGYYRVYATTKEKPDIMQDFSGEFVETPDGIADLAYLNNDILGISGNKEYLYDTKTDIIYSVEGKSIKKQKIYSDIRAREIMDSGYNVDVGSGDIVIPPSPGKNKGYKIVASPSCDSALYKVYDNGDIYAIGKKSVLLNTSKEEMENYKIDKWETIDLNEMFSSNKIFHSSAIRTYIYEDSKGDIYGIGDNFCNKLGLTEEQLKIYTGRDPVKLTIPGNRKIKKAYIGFNTVFLITQDNKLYACGDNGYSKLGLGHKNVVSSFVEVNVSNVENIRKIHNGPNQTFTVIEYNDNTYYFTGSNAFYTLSDGSAASVSYNTFTRIWNSGIADIDQDIKKVITQETTVLALKNDGTLLISNGYSYNDLTDILLGKITNKFSELREEVGKNITDIKATQGSILIEKTVDGEKTYYGWCRYNTAYIGAGDNLQIAEKKFYKLTLPQELLNEGVKEYDIYNYNIYFISNAGNVYGAGIASGLGIEGNTDVKPYLIKLPIKNIKEFDKIDVDNFNTTVYLKGNDGKTYTINNTLLIGNKDLQLTFSKISTNMLSIAFSDEMVSYIDKNNKMYVAGENESLLGLNKTTTSKIYQYTLNTDANIKDKVDKVFVDRHIFVLTEDKELYATGEYVNNGKNAPGWSEQEPKYSFVKILDNIDGFYTSSIGKIAYNSNSIYLWGIFDDCSYGTKWNIPVEVKLTGEYASLQSNIKDVMATYVTTVVLTKDGKVWTSGYNNGINSSNTYGAFVKIPESSFNNEKVVKVLSGSNGGARSIIAITENGNVYGWGREGAYLGIGESRIGIIQLKPIKLPITNVVDGIAYSTGFILTKDNGEIWGTGNNTYGILGRWLSKGGKYATSRYENAYEWVRCVDLEK